MTSLRFHIRFPETKIKEPIIYEIGHEFKVVTNVRRADVRETLSRRIADVGSGSRRSTGIAGAHPERGWRDQPGRLQGWRRRLRWSGWVDLELSGETAEIERAIEGFRAKGCVVDPIELNVVE